jgi:IS5 family transposase
MQQNELGLNLSTKRTRKRAFGAQMECVVPWACPLALIAPYSSKGKNDPPPSAVQTILQIHFLKHRPRRATSGTSA